jgi:thiol-disulfide isomerase/thioredoxin
MRIHKNILLLTLEGKPAPPLDRVILPKGKPALLYFWAHWCPDCKAEIPILARIKSEFVPQGLVFLAPTQKYGDVAAGADAAPAVETAYIEQVRQRYYAGVVDGPATVSEANFSRYGASTTPTLVLVDRAGIVRLYHPGAMNYPELRQAVARGAARRTTPGQIKTGPLNKNLRPK